ncbi:MAG: hypothetical protein Q7R50_00490 [Dehalococcoidales bacterium]|nr:hypothetical protein [Dehalococcoidales bacterium]
MSIRRSLYGRSSQHKIKRLKGNKRCKRTIEEKLRKYESHGEGYFFISALMHSLERYCNNIPDESKTDLDTQLATALDQIPNARQILNGAVKAHKEIPYELRRRIFSPKYLTRDIDKGIDYRETLEIMQASKDLINRNVATLNPGLIRVPGKQPDNTCCCCCCSNGQGQGGQTPPPTPPPNQYELTFAKLYCVDESNPEYVWMPWPFDNTNIGDEPYVVFATLTEEIAESGTPAQGATTPVYEDVDDGETRPDSGDENLRIFGFTGPRAINSSVLVAVSCFENDLGDPDEITDKVRTALTAVATKAAAVVAVAGIGVSNLVDLIGADDQIGGTLTFALTEATADSLTSSVNPTILAPLHFDGGDSDGIYDVYLKLRRV